MATESFNERQKAFLAYPRYGIVSTINADGSPQATIVWFMRDGDDLVFTVEAESLKSRNMRRDPRIVMAIADGGRFVSAKGSVELDERPEAGAEWLLRIAKRYYGEEEGTNQFNSFNQKPSIAVRLKVEKVLSVSV